MVTPSRSKNWGCLLWTRLRQSSTTHVCWHSPTKTFPLNSNHHHFHPQPSPHSMSFGLISSRFSHQIKPPPYNQLEKSIVADHTNFWGQDKQSTCDFNNLAKSTKSFVRDIFWSLPLIPKKEENILRRFAKFLYSFLKMSGR